MSNTEHFIPGKDAPLETSISRRQNLLATNFEASTKHQALLVEYRKLRQIA